MMQRQAGFRIEPFFLAGEHGPLFCIHYAPLGGAAKSSILYLHPFAEEMHKSRRMVAVQARHFAAHGHAVLQVDLTGCGDSSGDFEEATWAAWRDDVRRAHAWLQEQVPGPVQLWGLRSGAALAAEMSLELSAVSRLLLWQPMVSGEQFLTQFLRIKLASEMLRQGQSHQGTAELIAKLEAGASIEVGGYMLGPDMAAALHGFKLASLLPACPVAWLEVGSQGGELLGHASQGVVDGWRAAGVSVRARTIPGEPFWNMQEISECPELVSATLESLPQ